MAREHVMFTAGFSSSGSLHQSACLVRRHSSIERHSHQTGSKDYAGYLTKCELVFAYFLHTFSDLRKHCCFLKETGASSCKVSFDQQKSRTECVEITFRLSCFVLQMDLLKYACKSWPILCCDTTFYFVSQQQTLPCCSELCVCTNL